MNSEILDASLILPRMQEASLSKFVEADDRRDSKRFSRIIFQS